MGWLQVTNVTSLHLCNSLECESRPARVSLSHTRHIQNSLLTYLITPNKQRKRHKWASTSAGCYTHTHTPWFTLAAYSCLSDWGWALGVSGEQLLQVPVKPANQWLYNVWTLRHTHTHTHRYTLATPGKGKSVTNECCIIKCYDIF